MRRKKRCTPATPLCSEPAMQHGQLPARQQLPGAHAPVQHEIRAAASLGSRCLHSVSAVPAKSNAPPYLLSPLIERPTHALCAFQSSCLRQAVLLGSAAGKNARQVTALSLSLCLLYRIACVSAKHSITLCICRAQALRLCLTDSRRRTGLY